MAYQMPLYALALSRRGSAQPDELSGEERRILTDVVIPVLHYLLIDTAQLERLTHSG